VLEGILTTAAISEAGSTCASPGNEPGCRCTVTTSTGCFPLHKSNPFFHQRSPAVGFTLQTTELGSLTFFTPLAFITSELKNSSSLKPFQISAGTSILKGDFLNKN